MMNRCKLTVLKTTFDAELAKEYGLSASGIRTMLSRARKALKEKLNESKE